MGVLMEFLSEIVNQNVTTVCFIICMFTLSVQQLCLVRTVKKFWRLLIELSNGIMWLLTAFACLVLLHEGLYTGHILYHNAFHIFTPLDSIMYTVRIFASFIISGVSFDLASNDILKKC